MVDLCLDKHMLPDVLRNNLGAGSVSALGGVG